MLTNFSGGRFSKRAAASAKCFSTQEATYVRQFACHAFMRLEQVFQDLVFDLRLAAGQDFQQSFSGIKKQFEQLLNAAAADRDRLVLEFNRVCQPIFSADKKIFDVMAKINRHGNIELVFVEA